MKGCYNSSPYDGRPGFRAEGTEWKPTAIWGVGLFVVTMECLGKRFSIPWNNERSEMLTWYVTDIDPLQLRI